MIPLSPHALCIGILYCGDLGTALARLLRQTGVRVITTCEGRSQKTVWRAKSAEAEILATLDDVVRTADVIVSVVLPDAAEEVARHCADRKHLTKDKCLFIDTNSIDLGVLRSIQNMMQDAGIRFVDAAIHGGAARLHDMGVMYISGVHSAEAADVFGAVLRVLPLGEQIGQATRMKLLMAGQSKCLNVLFLQIAVLASKAGMLESFLTETQTFYPEIMAAIQRMLPTYPEHAIRRVTELKSIENLARETGSPYQIIQSSREFLEMLVRGWGEFPPPSQDISVITKSAASSIDAGLIRDQS